MPTLEWIGKKAVLNHHRQVPYRLLHCEPGLSVGDPDSGNLLVQGDNLLALKALLPYYAGKVKCIYIDPPYNSGEQTWTYNDHVDSPEIRRWLGKVVGAEAQDLSRHDKWLCMMYPRIALLSQFLRRDGFLLVSLDDTEIARFRSMMEEIMPPSSFIAALVWKSRRNLDSRQKQRLSVDHEYVLVYHGGEGHFRGAMKDLLKYSNPDNDPRGPWMSDNLVGLATRDRRPNLHYDLVNPETGEAYACSPKGWRYSRETMSRKIAEGRIIWPRSPMGRPRHKKFLQELRDEYTGFSTLVECGNTNEGTEELQRIMRGAAFIFPKPRSLIEGLLAQTTEDDDIILDSFAGSGTTGHATLSLNNTDGGNRRFILVEMDQQICRDVTAQRLARVTSGYAYSDGQGQVVPVDGLDGGYQYCTLGEPLFDEAGNIRESVTFSDLAAHVFFTETGSPMPAPGDGATPLLGVHNGRAVYLLFNGVMGDKRPNGGNVLTNNVLRHLPEHPNKGGVRVVYGEGCRLGAARLKREGIVFRQIPYEVKVS